MLNWDRGFSEYFSFSPLIVCFHHCSLFTFHSSSTDTTHSVTLEIDSFFQQNNSLFLQQSTTYVSSTWYIWFTWSAGLLTVIYVTHFKRISCRLGMSRLVIRNQTDDLHTQKPIHVLNMQPCTTERLVLLVGSSPTLEIFSLKKNTLICYRTLLNILNFCINLLAPEFYI
jgi:hypothetical protein